MVVVRHHVKVTMLLAIEDGDPSDEHDVGERLHLLDGRIILRVGSMPHLAGECPGSIDDE